MYGRMGLEKVVEESQEAGGWVVGGGWYVVCALKSCQHLELGLHVGRMRMRSTSAAWQLKIPLQSLKFSPNASGTPQ